MRLAPVALALAACSKPPAPPDPPICEPCASIDQWQWEHARPPLSLSEQHSRGELEHQLDRAAAARHKKQPIACLGTAYTSLVVVLDNDYVRPDCTRTWPHHLDVMLDGTDVDSATLPCTTAQQLPTPSLHVALAVPAGIHRIRVREAETGVSEYRDLVFPVDQSAVATLEITAEERVIRVGDLLADEVVKR